MSTKQEIRDFATQFGVEAQYSGHEYEDRGKGFFFKPVLLESLNRRLMKLIGLKLKITNEELLRKIEEQIKSTEENIESAKAKIEQFMKTDIYKNGLKDETPII